MEGPLRILHINGAMNRGGTETLIMELYRHMDRSKVQFDFIIYNYSDKPGAFDEEILSLGGRIYNAKRRFYRGPLAYCAELKRFFAEHPEYRIAHSHLYKTSGYILTMAKKYGCCVTIAHSHIANVQTPASIANFLRKCANGVGKKLIDRNADIFFGCSENALTDLSGGEPDGINRFIIKNAIDIQKFAYRDELRKAWREKLGAGEETVIIGNVASFTYQKNHEHILRTFKQVSNRYEDSLLVLIGVGGLEKETEDLAEELGIGDKTLFMGSRGDVNEIINAFDVFLMPSRYEGLGIVLIEAQANGLPCVISADVIPQEADVEAGLVTRLPLDVPISDWADACLNARGRLEPENAKQAVKAAGYDIEKTAAWLQEFYISRAE